MTTKIGEFVDEFTKEHGDKVEIEERLLSDDSIRDLVLDDLMLRRINNWISEPEHWPSTDGSGILLRVLGGGYLELYRDLDGNYQLHFIEKGGLGVIPSVNS